MKFLRLLNTILSIFNIKFENNHIGNKDNCLISTPHHQNIILSPERTVIKCYRTFKV